MPKINKGNKTKTNEVKDTKVVENINKWSNSYPDGPLMSFMTEN